MKTAESAIKNTLAWADKHLGFPRDIYIKLNSALLEIRYRDDQDA